MPKVKRKKCFCAGKQMIVLPSRQSSFSLVTLPMHLILCCINYNLSDLMYWGPCAQDLSNIDLEFDQYIMLLHHVLKNVFMKDR